jgi:hypothetical protein
VTYVVRNQEMGLKWIPATSVIIRHVTMGNFYEFCKFSLYWGYNVIYSESLSLTPLSLSLCNKFTLSCSWWPFSPSRNSLSHNPNVYHHSGLYPESIQLNPYLLRSIGRFSVRNLNIQLLISEGVQFHSFWLLRNSHMTLHTYKHPTAITWKGAWRGWIFCING